MSKETPPREVAIDRVVLAELADTAHERIAQMRHTGANPPEDLVDARNTAWDALGFDPEQNFRYDPENPRK